MRLIEVMPETIPPAPVSWDHVCSMAGRWMVDERLMAKLTVLAAALEFDLQIISGYRTPEEQDALRAEGRPAADNDKSTHLACPATGVDVRPGIAVTNVVKARLGTEVRRVGLRWGGGSPVDPELGIPEDWNHIDLGPRTNP